MSADLTYAAACSPDKQTGTKVMLSLHVATRVYRRGLQHNFNGSKTFRLRRSSAVRKRLLFMDETSYSHWNCCYMYAQDHFSFMYTVAWASTTSGWLGLQDCSWMWWRSNLTLITGKQMCLLFNGCLGRSFDHQQTKRHGRIHSLHRCGSRYDVYRSSRPYKRYVDILKRRKGVSRERIKKWQVTGSASTGKVTYRGAAKGSAAQAYYRVIMRLWKQQYCKRRGNQWSQLMRNWSPLIEDAEWCHSRLWREVHSTVTAL